MKITPEIQKYVDQSVLCWLATVSKDGIPNVSPKEIFTNYKLDYIIIANIASPLSVKNIKQNQNVCVSFIDILVQKGFQIKGKAEIVRANDQEFKEMEQLLTKMTEGKFPFNSIIKINIDMAKPILAPKYILFPKTTEQDQIESAKKVYQLKG